MKLRGASLLRRMPQKGRGCGEPHSIRSRIVAFLRSDSDGGAIVEAAIVMPIYLLILTGMLSTVMALYTYQQLDLATFTAAENIGISRGANPPDPCNTAVQSVTTGLQGYNTANITYTLWITQNVAGSVSRQSWTGQGSSFSCSGDTSSGQGSYALSFAQNEPLTLQLSYPYTWLPTFMNQKSGNFVTIETVFVN
jgi:Flp pilus assembly protein TadG